MNVKGLLLYVLLNVIEGEDKFGEFTDGDGKITNMFDVIKLERMILIEFISI